MECSSAYVDSSLFTVFVNLAASWVDTRICYWVASIVEHSGTTPYTLTETRSTHIETALWNHTGQLSVFISVSLLSSVAQWLKLTYSFKHIHMRTLIQSRMQNCVFWQDMRTGDYTHAADAGISLSLSPANPVSFAFERMRGGEAANESQKKKNSSVRCVGAFVSASSARVTSLTHTHKRG